MSFDSNAATSANVADFYDTHVIGLWFCFCSIIRGDFWETRVKMTNGAEASLYKHVRVQKSSHVILVFLLQKSDKLNSQNPLG